jgi:glycosyltransferase involved in cell wall biosynthesis
MSVVLGTLVLNEMQWLPKLYEQHKDWPGLRKWVFVESADRVYAETNSSLVAPGGLSVDGTTEFLQELAKRDDRVVHIKHGFCSAADPAQGKCEARSQYLIEADKVTPEYVIVLDADEFYMRAYQANLPHVMNRFASKTAFVFRHREIWHPVSVAAEPLFQYEVTGGFWAIPYCRCWRWFPGLRYAKNHNTPETAGGELLDASLKRMELDPHGPFFIHMGFAAYPLYRKAKNNYYVARGEGVTDRRQWYTESRALWETWRPGDTLPRGAQVIPYTGPIPEAFLE